MLCASALPFPLGGCSGVPQLIDVTLALAVAGRQKLRCWQAFGISTRIADFGWRSLPTLAWIFAMTDYREVAAWLSIALL